MVASLVFDAVALRPRPTNARNPSPSSAPTPASKPSAARRRGVRAAIRPSSRPSKPPSRACANSPSKTPSTSKPSQTRRADVVFGAINQHSALHRPPNNPSGSTSSDAATRHPTARSAGAPSARRLIPSPPSSNSASKMATGARRFSTLAHAVPRVPPARKQWRTGKNATGFFPCATCSNHSCHCTRPLLLPDG